MFTGIIRNRTRVERVTPEKGGMLVTFRLPKGLRIKAGNSINVDGICSTVVKAGAGRFEVGYMPETIDKTTVSTFRKGSLVNIERPLRLVDFVDGHLIEGHIDTRGQIIALVTRGTSRELRIKIPKLFMKFVVSKGSVAIDGVSLTVVQTGRDWFTVALIEYTLSHTTLGQVKKGSLVNVEVNMFAKYLSRFIRE